MSAPEVQSAGAQLTASVTTRLGDRHMRALLVTFAIVVVVGAIALVGAGFCAVSASRR